eukprot:GHUV01045383.1.p1 GENE.GHUV01045383.1~~GHUV01045383.1.p1  ORF type:complete len:123 (-),score=22.09 GHUV01045383.1:33-401(-)
MQKPSCWSGRWRHQDSQGITCSLKIPFSILLWQQTSYSASSLHCHRRPPLLSADAASATDFDTDTVHCVRAAQARAVVVDMEEGVIQHMLKVAAYSAFSNSGSFSPRSLQHQQSAACALNSS